MSDGQEAKNWQVIPLWFISLNKHLSTKGSNIKVTERITCRPQTFFSRQRLLCVHRYQSLQQNTSLHLQQLRICDHSQGLAVLHWGYMLYFAFFTYNMVSLDTIILSYISCFLRNGVKPWHLLHSVKGGHQQLFCHCNLSINKRDTTCHLFTLQWENIGCQSNSLWEKCHI